MDNKELRLSWDDDYLMDVLEYNGMEATRKNIETLREFIQSDRFIERISDFASDCIYEYAMEM